MTSEPIPEDIAAVIARLRRASKFEWPIIDSHDLRALLDYAERAREAMRWRPIESAPTDGSAFLGYGVHDRDAPVGASREVKAGDHWWGIILWDVWRGAPKFVFSKDGAATWSAPTHWLPLPPAPDSEAKR